MAREVLIIQPDSSTQEALSGIFQDWGDIVTTVSSLKEGSQALQYQSPNLILIDITLLGQNWPRKIPVLRKRFQHTDLIFTCYTYQTMPRQHRQAMDRWGVLRGPFTRYSIRLALQQRLFGTGEEEADQTPRPKLTYPIRFKITWPYLLLALLFTLAVSYITTRIVFDTVEERFTNQLIEAGKLSSEWMVIEERRLLETLRLTANTTGISGAVLEQDSDQLRELAYPIAVNAQEEALILLDAAGVSQLSLYHPEGANLEDYQVSSGEAIFADHEIVQRVLGKEIDAVGDKYAAVISTPRGPYFFIAGPIVKNDQPVGAVLVGKSVSTLTNEMRQATLAQTTIYDFEGNPLATTLLSKPNLEVTDAQQILSSQDQKSYYQPIAAASIDYTEILFPWEVRSGEDVGILGAAIPQNYLVSTSWITRAQIFVALAAFILLIVLVGSYLAQRISQPLVDLVEASDEIAQGNLMVSLPPKGQDEIALLTDSFNKMAEALRQSKLELMEAYDSSLEGWSRALTLRDHDTDDHSQRVVEMTLRLAEELGIPEGKMDHIRRGALLHDIGKVGIPDDILLKEDQLDGEEWEIMKKHPVLAFEMLQPIDYLQESLEIPLYHHERWDGRGYPYGLLGEEIPITARIFSVVDVYDALLSERPYRSAWTRNQALKYIYENRGAHFDPQIVDAFLKLYGGSESAEG